MKILVLNNDPAERSIILQVIQSKNHEMLACENSMAVWSHLQAGEVRFLIADRTNTDMDEKHLIEHIRSGELPASVYILLITSRAYDPEKQPARADDHLFKPISALDLKSRIAIGERIMNLGDNLLQARDQLENMALYDPLTNLLNQKAFLTTARGEMERARRNQAPLSLIMLDIDNFTALNEHHARHIGDEVLKLVARIIREKSRPYDCLGRWQGDEFISALPGVIGADAEKVAQRIIKGVRSIFITAGQDGPPISVEMSAGVATLFHVNPSTELVDLVQQARNAMLRAKEAGGNQVFLAYL
jgi:diguanylate cyclase (GGDEF)-like protein